MTVTLRGIARCGLWLGLYILLVLFPVPWVAFAAAGTRSFPDQLGAILGYLALSILALQFVLTARFRVLQPPFGTDALYAFHRGMAVVALLFALAHPLLMLPASELLAPLAPDAAGILAGLDRLDLSVWHSRHPAVPGWERGMGLLIHPPEGRGLMGVISLAADDPRGVPGLTQLRTYVGGAFPMDPALGDWPGVFDELRRWLPELTGPVQVRAEHTPRAFNLLGPGHRERAARVRDGLPPGLHWLGSARSGPSLKDLAQAIGDWADELPTPLQGESA